MKKIKKLLITPTLLCLSISPTLYASTFWKSDLNENLTNITKMAGWDNFVTDVVGQPWAGVGPNGEAEGSVPLYYTRIPAMVVTDDNKMVVMFDLRWNRAFDQDRIDPGVAVSSDGGYTWERKTAWTFNGSNIATRRTMDPTILYNSIDGSLYVMHGNWAAGTANWYAGRHDYFNNNIWSASIYKSVDGGLNWEKNAEFSKLNNSEVFSKVQRKGNPVIGFLGGVGSGIVMRDGTLVFPIQTAHNNGVATTIMYSKDNGKTWDMPEISDALAPNQISLENMVFEIGNKLVMTGRESRVGRSNAANRWAYYTEDLGRTWYPYPEAEFGSSTAQPTQGSSIYVTLPSGKRVLLVSKPNGNNDSWQRGNLALWMLDAKDPAHVHQVAIIRPGSGNAAGAGYSSLAYKEGNLFVAFEDDGDITVKNLTEYMPDIEAKALEWGLPDEIEAEVAKISRLPNLNQGQKDELIAKMRRANDYAITQSVAIDSSMNQLKVNSARLEELSKEMTKALPSRQRIFKDWLNYIKQVTSVGDITYLDYLGIQSLYHNFYETYLALNTKLDFSPYVKRIEQLNEYNTDILYRSFDKVFVHYDTGIKHNRLSLGINAGITDHFRVGMFFEHRNKNHNSYQVGARAKYELGNHQISGFLRYRGIKYNNFLERNKNIDVYLNYTYSFQIDEKLSISPAIGSYISCSSKTLIDEDVAVNKRTLYATDVGLNIAYKLNDISFYIRPNVAFINDGTSLSQSNDVNNIYKLNSHNTIYSVSTELGKRFGNGITVSSNLKLQRYGSLFSETSFGMSFSYHW